ncbi:MAG: OsmC family protein [Candidatus Woesearchaeota archaeon]
MVLVRSYVPAQESAWECDMNGAVRVGLSAKYEGSDENRTPEHLYAAALLNCFIATVQVLARTSGISYDAIEGTAETTSGAKEGLSWIESCHIRTVVHGCDDHERMERILERAEHVCTITNSVETRVEITASFSDVT